MKKLTALLLFSLFAAICVGQSPYVQYGLPDAIVVNKSDTTVYNPPLRALFFSATAAQTLTVGMAGDGKQILFTYGAAGSYVLPVSVVKVYSSGTNVTGIVGLREYTGKTTYPTPTSTPTATATNTPTPTP